MKPSNVKQNELNEEEKCELSHLQTTLMSLEIVTFGIFYPQFYADKHKIQPESFT